MKEVLRMLIFILQISLLYTVWVTKKTFEKYIDVKRGTYFYKKKESGENFYKEFYSKTETNKNRNTFGQNQGQKSFYDLLAEAGIGAVDYKKTLLFFNINKLPISDKEIKTLYREEAKKHHPDTGGSVENFTKFQEHFKLLTKSNDILKKNKIKSKHT